MINSIIEAISISLNEEFGDRCRIHMEEIKQGLQEPCFFIMCLSPSKEPYPGKRDFRENPFVIQYFPESADSRRECNDVAERMMHCLEYITIAGEVRPTRGTDMRYEIIDGILNFFVNYDFFTITAGEDAAMEAIESDTNIKEGGWNA